MYFQDEVNQFLKDAKGDRPLVAFLRGDLGAGKTTFVKTLVESIGGKASEVQSPTFLKLLEHEVDGFGQVIHVDAYRIEDLEGVEKLSLEAYENAAAWLVEWPDVFLAYLKKRPELRRFLGFGEEYWELDFEVKKVDPILGSGGGGEDNPVAGRGVRWRRKSFEE